MKHRVYVDPTVAAENIFYVCKYYVFDQTYLRMKL